MLAQPKLIRRLVVLGAAFLCPLPLRAQAPALEADRPRVERLTFIGAAALPEKELARVIVTEPTRCIGVLLAPLCKITDWRLIHVRRHLDRAELRADELRLRVHYFQRGYRQADAAVELRPRGRGVEAIFRIDEGPPTRVTALDVQQTEPVLTRRQLERADFPDTGEPLDLLRLSAGLIHLEARLGSRGHLDARLHDSVELSEDQQFATLRVLIEPGRRATLAAFDISGNVAVDDRTIRDALRLRRGRVLRTEDIVASQRSLYESNLFHEATVHVPEQSDSAKRVEVEVREASPRVGRVGGGFNTIEFLQLDTRFTHYNWLGRGRRLDVRATVGNLLAGQLNGRAIFSDVLAGVDERSRFTQPTWLASVDFLQPAFRSAENAVGLGVFAHRRTIPGIVIDVGVGAEASFTRRFTYRAPASLTYRFEVTSVEAGDLYFCVNYGICELPTIDALRGRQRLSPFGVNVISDRSNHPIAPTSGSRIRFEVEHASRLTASDFQYHRVSGAAARYVPLDLHRRRVLAGRVRLGWVHALAGTGRAVGLDAEDVALLHPRKRFYSGGARSVRGFRENQLGPRVLTIAPNVLLEEGGCAPAELIDGTCDPNAAPVDEFVARPTGGTAVLEANAELRFPVAGALHGAVFIDGAVVGERLRGLFTDGPSAITPGFGVRYDSPVGPIRVDLGINPRRPEELPVLTEFVDAEGERRLVRLSTLRRYDALEDTRGLARILGRLTLHLSIGEAF
jgi:outer membrane protein insertion porin family